MIAREPAEGTVEAGRIEASHADTCRGQALPKSSRGAAPAAKPVVHDPDRNPGARPGDERISEQPTGCVFLNDVILEVHESLSPGDGAQPGSMILVGILQDAHAIVIAEWGSAGARQGMLGKAAL